MTTSTGQSDTIILITHYGMGQAESDLQQRLIGTYLHLLGENDYLPAAICFYTEGVKLTVNGSPAIEQLQNLEAKGVRLIICGTCLQYYGVRDKVQVGIVGGMTDIIEAQWRASKVITL